MSPLYPLLEFVTLWRMRRILIVLFHLLVLTVPFAFSPLTDELFEFNKMILTYVFAILIATTWVGIMIAERRLLFRKTVLFLPLGLFLLSQVLSTVFSLHPHTSIFGYYTRFHGGLLSTLSYLTICLAAINTLDKKHLKPLIISTVLGAVGASLYALPEHFGFSPSCLILTGTGGVSCWVQDVQSRIFGTFGQPNWLAAYLLMVTPLCLWLAWDSWSPWAVAKSKNWSQAWKWSWPLLAAALFVAVLIFTKSRSGFLGLVAEVGGAICLAGILTLRRQQKSIPLVAVRLIGTWITVIALIVALLGSPFSPSLTQLITSQSPAQVTENIPVSGTVLEQGGTESGAIRKIVWAGAIKVWQRYPLLGSGVETFGYSYYLDRPREHNDVSEWDFLYNKAHNEFLNALATTGFFGLTALLILLGSFVFWWTKPFWANRNSLLHTSAQTTTAAFFSQLLLGFSLMLGLVGVSISNFFGFSTVMIGILTFLFPALWEISYTDELPTSKHAHKSAGSAQLIKVMPKKSKKLPDARVQQLSHSSDNQIWIAYTILGMCCLFALLQIWRMWSSDALFARVKSNLDGGEGFTAYEQVVRLTNISPSEATYWDQRALTMARLSLGTAETNATISGQLAFDALQASQKTLELNPHQLNFWKSRVRTLLLLGVNDAQYLQEAVEALNRAQELAPTDPKLHYNEALVWDALGNDDELATAYQKAIELRPNYEEARNSYAEYLRRIDKLTEAKEQYQYILDNLNPTAPTALEGITAIDASISAALATKSAQPRTGTKR